MGFVPNKYPTLGYLEKRTHPKESIGFRVGYLLRINPMGYLYYLSADISNFVVASERIKHNTWYKNSKKSAPKYQIRKAQRRGLRSKSGDKRDRRTRKNTSSAAYTSTPLEKSALLEVLEKSSNDQVWTIEIGETRRIFVARCIGSGVHPQVRCVPRSSAIAPTVCVQLVT